jgi:hypothetical protein
VQVGEIDQVDGIRLLVEHAAGHDEMARRMSQCFATLRRQ